MNIFQRPTLWTRIFEQVASQDADKAARLETSFLIFRERAAIILEKIAASLPNLTVHDITHIDSLWDVANLIVGPRYPLNPIEAFVLGGAMLLHDAALCFDAYENGLSGIRKTVHWRDAFAAEQERNKERENPQEVSELETAADFTAVRLLHADQAPSLIERTWIDPDTSSQLFLIDDSELRKHFGPIVGQIAASHNWSIEDVESRLPNQINAPGDWPTEWRIDPIKLACILRCADAAHIDNRRAPDFLYALTRREGISLGHWKAQNWLARADSDQSDPTLATMLFTSNREFRPNDADAWWIAFDAIRLVDKEIRNSNGLLKSRPQSRVSPEFLIRRVAGVSSPEAMSTFLRTQGWKPWHAELHVGNIERLVKNLGGKNLYGGGSDTEHLAIVLRELLQNARDSIAARKRVDPGHESRVKVRLVDHGSAPAVLEVIDDGVGMSQRVLTGPLLDFGSSFWKSDLLNQEFPGLRSSGFSSVGQFGIGFYSVFMVADAARVASRRWDRGLDTIASITFPKGLSLRPVFSTDTQAFSGSVSTIVTCTLKSVNGGRPSDWVYKLGPTNEIHVPFSDFVSRLVCGLDVAVDVRVNDGDWKTVHEPIEKVAASEAERLEWLRQITLAKHFPAQDLEDTAKRLQPIFENGIVVGLAALSLDLTRATSDVGVDTVGGFLSGGYTSLGGHDNFFGYMEHFPQSAKRDGGARIATGPVLQKWIASQLDLLSERTLTPPERLALTCHLCDFDFDPSPLLLVIFAKGQQIYLLSLDQVFEFVKSEPIALFKFGMMNHVDAYVQQLSYENYLTFKPAKNSSFLSLEMDGDVPKNPNSFIGCLSRRAERDGHMLKFETRPKVIQSLGSSADILLVTLEKRPAIESSVQL